MKKSGKLLTGFLIGLSLVVGFLAGLLVNYPPADETQLSGTIGKINNYRNVKISENDLQLRNELLSNKELSDLYLKYFSSHYLNSVRLADEIDAALKVSREADEFSGLYGKEVESLARFSNLLSEARKDLLLALSALKNLPDTDRQSIGLLLNNARNAIIQINFRGQSVLDFVDAVDSFLKTQKPEDFTGLKTSRDLLLLSQIRSAVLSHDKLKVKYLDNKELLSSKDSLLDLLSYSGDELKNLTLQDLDRLGDLITNKEQFLSLLDFEQPGILNNPENLGINVNNEKLGVVIDAEKLGLLDVEKLGVFDAEKLGLIVDAEKLGR